MRTTLIIDDDLLQRAREYTGIKEKTSLVRAGLEELIARGAARRLALLEAPAASHSPAAFSAQIINDGARGFFRLDRTPSRALHRTAFIGEIAYGNLKQRELVLSQLNSLPAVAVAYDQEAMRILEKWKLAGRGIGWIDTHLILSALLSGCALWTLDVRLKNAAIHVGVRHYAPILLN